jgi:gluconolactonase
MFAFGGLPMKAFVISLLAATAMGIGAAQAQNTVERLDPALDALVAPDTRIEKIHEDDQFFEGPVWHHGSAGSFLTFSDLISNRVDKWDPKTKQVSTYIPDVWKGKDNSNAIAQERNGKKYVQVGPNGQTLDKQGRLVFTAMGSGQIVRREADGKLTILADKYEGHHLNAPNDLVIKSDGTIYFTDIRAATKTTDQNPPEGVPHTGVYRIKDGKLELLVGTLEAPNGIAFSPDEKILYVNDIRSKKVMRYDVAADGSIANGRVFIDMNSDPRPGNPDGMKIDVQGNVWDSGPGGIWIVSPEGKHLGTILTPERLSNLAWGDDDGKTIYTTGGTMVTRIRVKVAGLRP